METDSGEMEKASEPMRIGKKSEETPAERRKRREEYEASFGYFREQIDDFFRKETGCSDCTLWEHWLYSQYRMNAKPEDCADRITSALEFTKCTGRPKPRNPRGKKVQQGIEAQVAKPPETEDREVATGN